MEPSIAPATAPPAGGARPPIVAVALLLVTVLVQPLAVLAADHYYSRWGSLGSVHNQWRAYRATPVPDVVIIGDSRVRFDIDTDIVGAALAAGLGHPATVRAIGIDAVSPNVLAAIVARLIGGPDRPQVLVLALAEHEYNRSWEDSTVGPGDDTRYLWQLTEDLEPAGARAALQRSGAPGRLVAGWLVPLLRSYSVIIEGLRCDLTLLAGRDTCTDRTRPPDGVVSDAQRAEQIDLYGRTYFAAYEPSEQQLTAAIDVLRTVRASGVLPVTIVLPVLGAPTIAPQAYERFRAVIGALDARAEVTTSDLLDRFAERPDLFTDLVHLNRSGARLVGPLIGEAIVRAGAR